MKVTSITVKGVEQPTFPSPETIEGGRLVRRSFLIQESTRGVGQSAKVDLAEDDLIELVFDDSTVWLCSPDTLEEVFPEAAQSSRSLTDSFEVPVGLRSEDSQRGILGDVGLKLLNIFAKPAIHHKVRDLAVEFEKKQLENRSGLYYLDSNFTLQPFIPQSGDKTYLLFLHGTASSTSGSFAGLANTETWEYIQQQYESNVLAFQHETLSVSPLRNVAKLVSQLPVRCSLHLISHSRGGLVGDVLARFCNTNENNRGFDKDELAYLRKLNRTDDREAIELIRRELQNKKIAVKKFIRVACPANGTLLASSRMDLFFNLTFNLIGYGTGMAASPAYTAFKNLVRTVVDSKDDVSALPGLEAMNPDSPFIKVLNSPQTKIALDDPLLVIAGNCKAKLNLKALVIIASKLFYLKDNDLVVNTLSMYQGTKRLGPVQYFFNDATDIDHFNYFSSKTTTDSLLLALKAIDSTVPAGFSLLQPGTGTGVERNAIFNAEGGQVFTNTVTGTKPIVVLLPGIMGSNLAEDNRLVWINYLSFIGGGLTKLAINSPGIEAPSLIRTSYGKLVAYLGATYDVVTFPFDWRRQLNEVATLFNEKITQLLQVGQPIKIIGHSMGGVLVRDFIVQHPTTWKTLNQSRGFKLIFLGAPLGGSFRIPSVLFGRDALIEKT